MIDSEALISVRDHATLKGKYDKILIHTCKHIFLISQEHAYSLTVVHVVSR